LSIAAAASSKPIFFGSLTTIAGGITRTSA
jgi:hypothetical protein